MTDREIWEQLAALMGMLLEAEEVQVAQARNLHARMALLERRVALLAREDPAQTPEAALLTEACRILARQESRHELYGALLAELKALIEGMD